MKETKRLSGLLFVTFIIAAAIAFGCSGGGVGDFSQGEGDDLKLQGTVLEGGTCTTNTDCVSGLTCQTGFCVKAASDGSATPEGTIGPGGTGCESDSGCANGMVCQSASCVASSGTDGVTVPDVIIQLTAPEFSKVAGVYNTDISVIITCSVDGSTIYYTVDGSEPTEASDKYAAPISISGHDTKKIIKAKAFKTGMAASQVAVAAYTISYLSLDDPVFDKAGGTYDKDISIVLTSANKGADIYYTLDGQQPIKGASPKYIEPIKVSGNGTEVVINAQSFKDGYQPSKAVTQKYKINYATVSMPQIHPLSGVYEKDVQITISTSTTGAEIRYTNDGSEPNQASLLYSGPINVVGGVGSHIIRARAYKAGMLPSSIASESYVISYAVVEPPYFQPAAGAYHQDLKVAIATLTTAAKIYYTTDGSEPAKSSKLYSAPVELKGEGHYTIKAKAFVEGGGVSDEAAAAYSITYEQVATPQFFPPPGSKGSDVNVAITSATEGAKIYYTENGSIPKPGQASALLYEKPISVAGEGANKTIVAKAFKEEFNDSDINIAVYQIHYSKVSTPVFAPSGGTYGKDMNIELSNSTSGSAMFYTTNGTDPLAVCNPSGCGAANEMTKKYTGPIAVAGNGTNLTIKAIAIMNGVSNSNVASTTYTINYSKVATPQFKPAPTSWELFNADKNIEITSATAGAKIYYTENGSEPTAASILYAGPFTIKGDGEHTIKAKAFKDVLAPSDVAAATYKISYKWYRVSAGGGHTCAIREYDNSLWCWGGNGYGELGFGDVTFRYKPEKVPVDGQWGSISAGLMHTCAIKSDGTLWCWGANNGGQLGLGLAPANVDKKLVPQQVMPDKQWYAVSSASMHTCAIDSDLKLWCWGMGEALGLGSVKYAYAPQEVGAGSEAYWKSVETGANHTCAVKAVSPFELEYDGSLWCWGTNSDYAIGISNPNVQSKDVPTQVVALDAVKSVSAGYQNTFAIDGNWYLWIWGKTASGSSVLPQKTATQLIDVSAGSSHECGILLNGGGIIKCVGDNSLGQLGLGNTDPSITSGTIPNKLWQSVAAGGEYSCAIEKYGKTLWCWGSNDYGQLGIGDKYPTGGVPKQVLIK